MPSINLGTVVGKSAYQIAVDGGYSGSEAEWLVSLVGKSAYQVAVDGGYSGTEAEWVASLEGTSAYQIDVDAGFPGTKEEWLDSLDGTDGITPAFTIGVVVTMAPGEDATASITGTVEAPVLNLGIPRGGDLVTSVNGLQGVVVLDKTHVGLGNVDNTSDADKPVSTATAAQLLNKVDKVADKGLSTNDYTDADKAKLDNLGTTTVSSLNGKTGVVNIIDGTNTTVTTVGNNVQVNTTFGSLNNVFTGASYNSDTGDFSFTQLDGTTEVVNLPVEMVVESGTYDPATQKIILTLTGGDVIEIPAADLVDTYIGDTTTISLTGNVFSVHADVIADITSAQSTATSALEGLEDKVDKVTGKGLSTNDFTDAFQTKLDGIPTDIVQSVNGESGVVTITKATVGLTNVDNTADADKPISTAVQDALDAKVGAVAPTALTEALAAAGIEALEGNKFMGTEPLGLIKITATSGSGHFVFTAKGDTAFELPAGAAWDGETDPNFATGKQYRVGYLDGTFYADMGR